MKFLKNIFNISILSNLLFFGLNLVLFPFVFNEDPNEQLGIPLTLLFLFHPYLVSILSIGITKKINKTQKLRFYEILVLTSPVFILLNQIFNYLNNGLTIDIEELLLVHVIIFLIYLLLSFFNYKIFKRVNKEVSSEVSSNKISKILFFIIIPSIIIYLNSSTEIKSTGNKTESSEKCSDMDSYNKGKKEGRNNKLLGVDCNYYYEMDKQWVENKYCFCKGFNDYNKN